MRLLAKLGISGVLLCLSTSTHAQVTIFGDGPAKSCYDQTKLGNMGSASAIKTCEDALKDEALPLKDLASTHVNTGILYMRGGQYDKAQTHYSQALKLRPRLSEAYINQGANFIYQRDYNVAITALSKSIDLGTDKMPEALYNRSMAYNGLQNYKAAYLDLKRALELKPDWPLAAKALEIYSVTPAPKTH